MTYAVRVQSNLVEAHKFLNFSFAVIYRGLKHFFLVFLSTVDHVVFLESLVFLKIKTTFNFSHEYVKF